MDLQLFAIFSVLLTAFASLDHLQSTFLIHSLPGWNEELPSRMFSGYLNVSSGSRLFFWFVESENDPSNSPTTLWLNGGPGCSSLDGFWYELGPFQFAADGSLEIRPNRWSRISNMLFIENPVGVGLSYSISESPYRYSNSDDRTPVEAAEALQFFFKVFPHLQKNPFYLSGESYAGIYVPTIAEQILKLEDQGAWTSPILKGIAVGNGCTGSEIGICGFYFGSSCDGLWYEYSFLEGFSFFDLPLKNRIAEVCDWDVCRSTSVSQRPSGQLSTECLDLVEEASLLVGFVNTYNVFGTCVFESCEGPEGNLPVGRVGGPAHRAYSPLPAIPYSAHTSTLEKTSLPLAALRKYRQSIRSDSPSHLASQGPNDDSLFDDSLSMLREAGPAGCIDSAQASAYMNRAEVLRAIHARDPGFCWAVCNQAPGFTYNITRPNLPRDTYPGLISRMKVVIYNGDWDACVPYTDNEAWTENMGYSVLGGEGGEGSWSPWSYHTDMGDGFKTNSPPTSAPTSPSPASSPSVRPGVQVGGYRVKYDVSAVGLGKGAFEFFTVRGAGHMVPLDAPQQALALFSRFLGIPVPQGSLSPPSPIPSNLPSLVCDEHRGGGPVALIMGLVLVLVFSVVVLCRENRLLKGQGATSVPLSPTSPSAHGAGTIELSSTPSPLAPSMSLSHPGAKSASPSGVYRAVNVQEDI